MLTPPPHHTDTEIWADYKTVQDRAQLLGKTLYHQGDLSYFEAVNKEALKNAFSRSEDEGIITVQRPRGDGKIPPRVRLDLEWMPARDEGGGLVAEGRLWEMCERISQSRREGKNRRDGTTVRTRVLGLAELVGRGLFGEGVVGEEGMASRGRRRGSVQMKAQL